MVSAVPEDPTCAYSRAMRRTVTTTGHGSVPVVPDAAVVNVVARHRAAGVAEASAGVDSAVRTVGEVARRHTDERRIASVALSIWPTHDRDGAPDGFEARHSLRVGVADLAVAGRLIAELADEVGERLVVEGVSLTVSEPGPALAAAREAAFVDARAKAEALAELSGAVLGEVVTVTEGDQGTAMPLAVVAGARAKHDLAFEAGERGVDGTVTVTWRLL